MSLSRLDQVLSHLQRDPAWQEHQHYRTLCQRWSELVGASVAAQSRPTGLQRSVLYVAVSSAVWAQTLTFERPRILRKLQQLNATAPSSARLPEVRDLKFSTAQWQTRPLPAIADDTWRDHPSRWPAVIVPTPDQSPETATAAFAHWAQVVQARAQHLPSCPRCHCPTPPRELERWQMCAVCMAAIAHESHSPPS